MVTTSIKNVKRHLSMQRVRREHEHDHSPVLIQSKHSKALAWSIDQVNHKQWGHSSEALCMYTIAWGRVPE